MVHMLESYVKKILGSRVYDLARETPLQSAPLLSGRLGHEVYLKREDLQPVFSFKLRGSYNKIASLSSAELEKGVITASAGNHAQGVAMSAKYLGVRATIVMGRNTPSIKVDAVKSHGARAVLFGDGYDQAAVHAHELAEREGYTYIHAYDDKDVIAGQGTVGMEIVNQHPGRPDVVFVPVGGGGLIAGIAAYIKYLYPQTKIIGVEPRGSDCLAAALAKGRRVKLPAEELDLFADGVSVAQIGNETFKVAKKYVDDVVVVSVDEICAAIKDVFEETRVIAEPAGALAVAGMKSYLQDVSTPQSVVAVVSGANVNFDRLRHISERAELGEHREAVLAVTINEEKGSFLKFCRALGKRGITEFNYRYAGANDPAHVYVGLSVATPEDRSDVVEGLHDKGYDVLDMTENEAAKLHVRHMVGGRHRGDGGGDGEGEGEELLFRFEFPERPGALLQFLGGLGSEWNITLFHYRNHGAAFGRVLVGFAAGRRDRAKLTTYLREIGYRYWEETENPAYRIFLS